MAAEKMKCRTQRPHRKKNEHGMATIEVLPLIIIFVVMIAYMLGAFGIVHTGILSSIASRTYAFETFRHRTNLVYLRSNAGGDKLHYTRYGNRVHTVINEFANGSTLFHPSERRLAMGLRTADESRTSETVHSQAIYSIRPGQQNTTIGVNPAWIMTQYGICLTATCREIK